MIKSTKVAVVGATAVVTSNGHDIFADLLDRLAKGPLIMFLGLTPVADMLSKS